MLKLFLRSLSRLLKPARMVAIALTLLLLSSTPLFAQTSAQLGSRISRLETENTTLRSRVSRLENALSRVSRGGGGSQTQLDPALEESSSAVQPDDPMFDRLATLVVETKQQVLALEERVAALEAQ
jgi:BMFP domain-containing protein YqiC